MRLARIPTMMDFVNNGFINPHLFIDYAGSYYEFLKKMDKEYTELLPAHRTSLQFISCEFSHGWRMHEVLLLKLLLENDAISLESFTNELKLKNVNFDENVNRIIKVLSIITDVLDYAITKAQIKPNEILGDDNLIYYRKYSRKDVFKIMNFDKDQNPQNVGGYIIQEVDGRKNALYLLHMKKVKILFPQQNTRTTLLIIHALTG